MEQGRVVFFSIDQFRSLKGTLNVEDLVKVILDHARQPKASLKDFLSRTVLCNHGRIIVSEIRDLTTRLFVGEKADEMLRSLDRDQCLGYSPEELDNIRIVLQTPEASHYYSTSLQEALGCKILKNPFRAY